MSVRAGGVEQRTLSTVHVLADTDSLRAAVDSLCRVGRALADTTRAVGDTYDAYLNAVRRALGQAAVQRTTTGATGEFTFRGLPPGLYVLSAEQLGNRGLVWWVRVRLGATEGLWQPLTESVVRQVRGDETWVDAWCDVASSSPSKGGESPQEVSPRPAPVDTPRDSGARNPDSLGERAPGAAETAGRDSILEFEVQVRSFDAERRELHFVTSRRTELNGRPLPPGASGTVRFEAETRIDPTGLRRGANVRVRKVRRASGWSTVSITRVP